MCTFFYPWYGHYRHWDEGGHTPPLTWASNYLPDPIPGEFNPSEELYDSSDVEVILWQLALMKKACIQVAICSWWGIGSYEDKAFRKIMKVMESPECPYRNLKWCIYYEKEGYGDPSVEEITTDISYIIENYASLPYYFKIMGRPVVFVYAEPGDGYSYVKRWAEVRRRLNVYTVLKVFDGYLNYAWLSDSWHQYGPAVRYEKQMSYSAYVSPGFWRYHEEPRLSRDIGEFEEAVAKLAKSGCRFLLIETWNEYHEGTQVEPSQPIIHDDANPPFRPAAPSYGCSFLDVLARYLAKFSPRPLTLEVLEPSNNTLVTSPVRFRVRAKSPYSSKVEVFVSVDDSPFKKAKFTYTDQQGFLCFELETKLREGEHKIVIYARDSLDFFSENAILRLSVSPSP